MRSFRVAQVQHISFHRGCRSVRPSRTRIGVGFGPGGGQNQPPPDLTWDPDNILGPPETGHIARRETERMIKKDKKFGEALSMAQSQEEKERLVRRQARVVPDEPEELIEFFLNTNLDDMEFEVARCRPKLTSVFFDKLNDVIGDTRFKSMEIDEERLAELETLRDYLKGTSKAVDEVAKHTTDAVERFKKLLVSKDKKATILEMVAQNEIDQGLIDLMAQNVRMAEDAKETKKAEFMEKLQKACEKYVIKDADEKRPSLTPPMNASRAGAVDVQQTSIYDPSSPPTPDPNILNILDPTRDPLEDQGRSELIVDP